MILTRKIISSWADTGYFLLELLVVYLTMPSAAYYSNDLANVMPNYMKRIYNKET
jgi:hypothetical protein